jgi:hypothetical protein
MSDWRLDNVRRLGGVEGLRFRRKRYTRWSDTWTHDHCIGCWARFAEFDGPGIPREGYATGEDWKHSADYDWVCLSCFADLREAMGWIEVPSGTAATMN